MVKYCQFETKTLSTGMGVVFIYFRLWAAKSTDLFILQVAVLQSTTYHISPITNCLFISILPRIVLLILMDRNDYSKIPLKSELERGAFFVALKNATPLCVFDFFI